MSKPGVLHLSHLRAFVMELQQNAFVPVVDMMSGKPPWCGTPHCHAGEAWLALCRLGVMPQTVGVETTYDFCRASDFLAGYLVGVANSCVLAYFFGANCELWGNPHGQWMFTHRAAFPTSDSELSNKTIKEQWLGVLRRCETAVEIDRSDPRFVPERLFQDLEDSVNATMRLQYLGMAEDVFGG